MIASAQRDTMSAPSDAPAIATQPPRRRNRTARRYVDLLPRALGVLIPLGFGMLVLDLPLASVTFPLLLTMSIVAAIGLVGGALIRLRRAVYIVPAAFFVGLGIGHSLHGWFSAGWPGADVVVIAVAYALLQWCLPLIIGAVIGLPVGIWVEELFQHGISPRSISDV